MGRQPQKGGSTERNELSGSGQSVIPVWITRCPALRGPVRDVLVNLAARRGPDNPSPWPSERTIAADLGVTDRTVRRAMERLKRIGLIRVEVHGGPGGRVNLYHLEIDGAGRFAKGLPADVLAELAAGDARKSERRRVASSRGRSVGNDYGHQCPVSADTGVRQRCSSEEARTGAAVVMPPVLSDLGACARASAVGLPGAASASPQSAADPGLPGAKSPSGEASQAPDRPDDDPEPPPPIGPGGGRPAPEVAPGAPSRPAAEASTPAGPPAAPLAHQAEITAPSGPPAVQDGQAPLPASTGRALDTRQDLVPFGPFRPLAAAALAVGLSPGEAAREVLAGCPPKVALAWLLAIARKRGRLRSPGALFRWGCRSRGEPALVDLVAADRLLRGAAGEELPRGSMPAHRWACQVRALAADKSAALAEVPAWRRRRAELEAAAQAERDAAERRLRRLLPTLAGEERAQVEGRLALLRRTG